MNSPRFPTFVGWWLAVKRSHGLNPLPDIITRPFRRLAGIRRDHDELSKGVMLFAQAQRNTALLVNEMQRRLEFYENEGPLQAARHELNRRRGDGMLRPVDAKRKAPKPAPRSIPRKMLDASGRAIDVAAQHWKCDDCEIVFLSEAALINHRAEVDGCRGPFRA